MSEDKAERISNVGNQRQMKELLEPCLHGGDGLDIKVSRLDGAFHDAHHDDAEHINCRGCVDGQSVAVAKTAYVGFMAGTEEESKT